MKNVKILIPLTALLACFIGMFIASQFIFVSDIFRGFFSEKTFRAGNFFLVSTLGRKFRNSLVKKTRIPVEEREFSYGIRSFHTRAPVSSKNLKPEFSVSSTKNFPN